MGNFILFSIRHFIFIFLCVGLLLNSAEANRTLVLPMFSQSSMHGGVSPTGTVCVAANMLYPTGSGASLPPGQVGTANHIFILRLQNISATPQTVTVGLNSLHVQTSISQTDAEGITTASGPSVTTAPSLTKNVLNIPANGLKAWNFVVACSGSNCAMGEANYLEYAITGGGSSSYPDIDNVRAQYCTDTNRNCLAQSTSMQITLDIAQDRGALIGSLSTWVHRCNGWTDLTNGGIVSLQLNGGRAF